jgi:nitrous-oxide reductase
MGRTMRGARQLGRRADRRRGEPRSAREGDRAARRRISCAPEDQWTPESIEMAPLESAARRLLQRCPSRDAKLRPPTAQEEDPMRLHLLYAAPIGAVLLTLVCVGACQPPPQRDRAGGTGNLGASSSVKDLMKARGLSDADVEAALKTYVPPGKKDEYYIFFSGGHSGQVVVTGVPSMRILKQIAVFSPEPWQGYGYGGTGEAQVLASGRQMGHDLSWGDVHHPALSETNGDYDGQYLFVNDKANARIAVIDLKDFVTKQIVVDPLIASNHGGAFVTPNTEYIIEGSQYAAPLGRSYAPISDYDTKYRGAVTFWKFDRAKGRIDPSQSWAIELPPYAQDLSDAGKLDSDGWAFLNSFNTERATGGDLQGKPTIESGASQNDMDYLHIIDWKKAESLIAAGTFSTIAGMRVISLDDAAKNKVLTFVGESKSPHGCDVTPDGKEIVVSGKLDTHATVYSFAKIKQLIAAGDYDGKDPYGVPILSFKDTIRGQVELGLGPLHTQFDDKGNAYTSLFLDSAVAKWSLKDLKLLQKLSVHYNIGHLLAAEGDTVSPDGKYVVALDKMSLDRFGPVGPLFPQNEQLIDVSGDSMRLLADMPLGIGEPHYAQMIKADKLHPEPQYPLGTNPYTGGKDPAATTEAGKERIERHGDTVDVYMTAIRSHFTPDQIEVNEGDTVNLHLTSLEQSDDQTHGFAIDMYNINLSLEPGKHENVSFKADAPGVFPFYCTEFCSALHLEMTGYLLVKPKGK